MTDITGSLKRIEFVIDTAECLLADNQVMSKRLKQALADCQAIRDAVPIADQLSISLEKVSKDKQLYAQSRWHEKNIWNAAQTLAKIVQVEDNPHVGSSFASFMEEDEEDFLLWQILKVDDE